jgi:sugar transferase (PEP-CTERM system associated)
LLLGSGRPAQIIADVVNGCHPHYQVLGCVDGHPHPDGQPLRGVQVLGTVEELERVSRMTRPDVIVVALTERRQALPLPAILDCKLQGIEVQDWPSFYEKLTGRILVTGLRPSWLIFADGFRSSGVTVALKRAMDVVLSVLALLASAPLCCLIALLIKLDSAGPVFYRQGRVGQGGRVFALIKFRSMHRDAERETGPVWAEDGDPRATRVGRLLRRTRLDELPQFINVLRGEMSLVGPRPERPAFVEYLQSRIPFYMSRYSIKPGITGWAQVQYRYGSTLEDAVEKLEYDLYYIKNQSLFLDLLILLHTLQVVVLGKGSR